MEKVFRKVVQVGNGLYSNLRYVLLRKWNLKKADKLILFKHLTEDGERECLIILQPTEDELQEYYGK